MHIPAPDAQRGLSPLMLNLCVAAFIMALHNNTFWARSFAAYDGSFGTTALFGGAVFALTLLVISLFAVRWLQKPVLVFLLLLGAVTAYYQDTLGATIDREMIQNAITTTVTESKHLITAGFLFHVAWAGILPAAFVLWVPVKRSTYLRGGIIWALSTLGSAALCVGFLLVNFSTFSVTLRADKSLMAAYQPGAPLSATLRFARMVQKASRQPLQAYGTDAKTDDEVANATKPILMVIVAGETARAQNWSLGGYARDTNPELAKRDITYFSNVASCGTATAVSLPCMFSHLARAEYSYEAGLGSENLLDVLGRAGYRVEWWDNNTGDKNISDRFKVTSIINSTDPRFCADGECTDGIFLEALRDYAANLTQNTVLVLHMIGSHGPSYYLRYPPEMEVFTPACKTAELKECSTEEITNAYDNTIHYTDYVLAQMIDILQSQDHVLPALIYASDHGESLGENGLYLHGAPYFMAPDEQTRVPMLLWMSQQYAQVFELDRTCIAAKKDAPAAHDNLYSTILRLTDVHSKTIDQTLDLTAGCHPDES
jgi:lipid A ethanolaminephosphotransferase